MKRALPKTEHGGKVRPVALIEGPGDGEDELVAALESRGMDVLRCPGPSSRAEGCPLLHRGSCSLLEAADLVVNAAHSDPAQNDLARETRIRYPMQPLILLCAEGTELPDAPGARVVQAGRHTMHAVALAASETLAHRGGQPRTLLARNERRVFMGDVDSARVLYFARPYRWHEELFTGWLASIGHPVSRLLREHRTLLAVASHADYLGPLVQDQVVSCELTTVAVGGTSCAIRSTFSALPAGHPSVRVTSWHVWSELIDDPGLGGGMSVRSAPLPEWLRRALGATG